MRTRNLLKFFGMVSLVILALSACSNEPTLELVDSSVELNHDQERLGASEVTSGENEGEKTVPFALSYDFTLKNTGLKKIGKIGKFDKEDFKNSDAIELRIEPKEKLKNLVDKYMDFNIFSEDEMIGLGETGELVLGRDEEGKYTLDYELGFLEENPNIKLAPPKEELEKVAESAMNAYLLVYSEGEEIARFDLNDFE